MKLRVHSRKLPVITLIPLSALVFAGIALASVFTGKTVLTLGHGHILAGMTWAVLAVTMPAAVLTLSGTALSVTRRKPGQRS